MTYEHGRRRLGRLLDRWCNQSMTSSEYEAAQEARALLATDHNGRGLLKRLLACWGERPDDDASPLDPQEALEYREARALLAVTDSATVRAEVAERLRAEAKEFRALASVSVRGLDAPVSIGAVVDGLEDFARRLEEGEDFRGA